jgi:hypothetical protein
MVLDQLLDSNFYQELESCEDWKKKSHIKKFIHKLQDNTTEKEKDYQVNFEVKTSNFYGLPKVTNPNKYGTEFKTLTHFISNFHVPLI